jgi:hypothetical protein
MLLTRSTTAVAKHHSLRHSGAPGKVELELKLGHMRDGQFVSSMGEVSRMGL